MSKPQDYLLKTFQESTAVRAAFFEECQNQIVAAAEAVGQCFQQGGKVLIFGNGGSASDAQHMAGELIGRMLVERRALPAIALTADTSNLTAIGNDYGFQAVFARQVQALAQPEDVIIAISTSGKSENVLLAVAEARKKGCKVIGLTGGAGGKLKDLCDICLCATAGSNSSRIQEAHSFAIHSIVDLLDRFFLDRVVSEIE